MVFGHRRTAVISQGVNHQSECIILSCYDDEG